METRGWVTVDDVTTWCCLVVASGPRDFFSFTDGGRRGREDGV